MNTTEQQFLERGRRGIERGELTEAIATFEQASAAFPDHPAILKHLAEANLAAGRYLPALKALDRIIELEQADRDVWLTTGNALSDLGEFSQAIGAYQNSVEIDPSHAESHHNLARACYQLGDVSRACDHLEIAIRLGDSINSWQSLATLVPSWPQADHRKLIRTRRAFAEKLAGYTGTPWPTPADRPPCRRQDGPIRIGYLCAFFHNANYTKPVWALINRHDRSRFQISLFADGDIDNGMPCYVPHESDRVYDVRPLDNRQLAEVIRDADIDILVDLNAYSYESRLSLFLQYPAPVVAAWWNMYASSGMPCIDYVIGDEEMIRPEELEHYSETVLSLPLSYLTFSVEYPVPPIVDPPCVESRRFTFGSLVTQYKITPFVLDAWCEILRAVDRSRILLANRTLRSAQNRAYVIEQFERRGVSADRIELRGPADHDTFLRNYNEMDIALDAFPYNGGTTTMEAIWQGVPVLTFDGDRWVSRTSQTLLRRCHLGEFVGKDVDDMIAIGIRWASSPESPARLSKLRHEMRDRLAHSSACDTEGLAKGMEQIYKKIWRGARAE